jgi:hypothetical protein
VQCHPVGELPVLVTPGGDAGSVSLLVSQSGGEP